MSQSCENAFIQQSLGLHKGTETARAPGVKKPVWGSGAPLPFSAPAPPPQYNEDGTVNLDWARYESAQRLRRKWESIYERFKDAHLEDQDEIYLGRASVENDELRVIKDCGSLRALKQQLEFGSFMSEEEREALSFADWQGAGDGYPGDDETEASDAASAETPDALELAEFMALEARRRERRAHNLDGARRPGRPRQTSPSVAEELDIYRSVKRDAVESFLRSGTLGQAALPYDIPELRALSMHS